MKYNKINLAQQVTGCNPSIQSCSPPQPDTGRDTGTGGNNGGESGREGCGVTMSCEPVPCRDRIECETGIY